MRKILFLILLVLLGSSSLFAVDNPVNENTDSSVKVDTNSRVDTLYLFDTTLVVAKQVAQLKGEFYDQAIKSIEFKMSFVNILMGIIGLLLTLIAVYSAYVTKNLKSEVKEQLSDGQKLIEGELNKIRKTRAKATKDGETIEELKNALATPPDNYSKYYTDAIYYSSLGDKESMLTKLREAIKVDSKYKRMALFDNDFEEYLGDPDFFALTKEDGDYGINDK